MPTFLGRRYARPPAAISSTEKNVGAFVLLLVAGVVAAFFIHVALNRDFLFVAEEGSSAAAPQPVFTFPDPGLAGWQPPAKVERFTADELYIKIDGRAEALLRFHVVGLTFGTYTGAGEPAPSVDVYCYDMSTPADAEAVYHAEAPPGTIPSTLGSASYEVGGAVFFWKGASYVQVLPSQPDEVGRQAAWKIAERLATRIP